MVKKKSGAEEPAVTFVHLNGQLLPSAAAKVSALDAGLLLGAGLFETMRAYNGFVFRVEDHLDRLFNSSKALEIPIGPSRQELIAALAEVIQSNALGDARCRITVTRGALPSVPGEAPATPTCLVTAGEMTPYSDELYEQGMTVTVSDVRVNDQDPIVNHKTTSYMTNLMVLRDAHGRGAQEALRFNGPGRLAEGCISNVFVVRGGRLLTPPLAEGCLPGITRKVVLELAAEEGIEAAEEPLRAQEILGVEEMFVTNTIMEVMPVCRIERQPLGDEKPGPVTRRLMELYKERVRMERNGIDH